MYIRKKALFIALIITIGWSIVTGLYIIRTVTTVRDQIAELIAHHVTTSAACHFHTNVTAWGFLPPHIICTNTYALPDDILTSPDNQARWSWHCKQISFNFSLFGLIFMQKLIITVEIDDLTLYSQADQNTIDISDHLQKVFLGKLANLSINIKIFKLNSGHITINIPKNNAQITCTISGISKKNGDHFKSAYYLSDGSVWYNNTCYLNHLTGMVHAHFAQKKLQDILYKIQAHTLPNTPSSQLIYLEGTLQNDVWHIQARNQENTGTLEIHGTPLEKKAQVSISSTLLEALTGMQVGTICNDKVIITGFLPTTGIPYGSVHLERLPLSGDWYYSNRAVHLDLNSTATIAVPLGSWVMQPTAHCIQSILSKDSFDLMFSTTLAHTLNKKELTCMGKLTLKNNTIYGNFTYPNYTVTGTGTYNPIDITITCTDKNSKPCGSLRVEKKDTHFAITAHTSYQELYPLLDEPYKTLFPGTGTIDITGTIGYPCSVCNLKLTSGYIQLGKSYNSCQQFETNVCLDQQTNTLVFNNTHGTLHHGTIYCPQARLDFDHHWHLSYLHAPISFNRCLVNWNENIGICSGALTLQHRTNNTLQAHIAFEKTDISGSIFQKLQQKNTLARTFANTPLNLNVKIETKKAIHITLPHLQAKAHAQVSTEGSLAHPQYSGTITLQNGALYVGTAHFAITSGTIHLAPDNPENSFVTIQAHTNKANHEIMLHLIGNIAQPTIKLSATPALSDQQIIALILAGSSETSLNTILPTLITQQIKELVTQYNHHTSSIIDNQTKKITLTPRFSSTRGTGLQGGIELDFGERLKAKIKKNIDLQENFALEVDYHMSDDLNIKAFKNEKGQMGGQASVKFRW